MRHTTGYFQQVQVTKQWLSMLIKVHAIGKNFLKDWLQSFMAVPDCSTLFVLRKTVPLSLIL